MKWNIFREPYPFDDSIKRAIISAIFFGTFIFVFLRFFEPFGLSNYQSDQKTVKLLGYGAITSFTLIVNYLFFTKLFPNWFNSKTWTVSKNIFYTTWMFFCIGFANLTYSVFQDFLQFSLNGFLFFQGMTVMVGIIPVTLSTFFVYNKKLSDSLKQASELNASLVKEEESHDLINIPSKNKSEELQVDVNNLLAVKAVENYVEVYLKKEDNGLKKEVLRNSLKDIETTLSSFFFIKRCHRSYLVNLQLVENFSGNAQGLNLNFAKELDFEVPVSRSYVKSIKESLKQN
jgi:hypothetical protein